MPAPSTPNQPLLSTQRPLQGHEPFVHDLIGVFRAPVQAWAAASAVPVAQALGAL